ncbi:MAG: hypothetical protein JNL30_00985 [Rubrivivax sp.]|nr:hypothetical protein [Rubrivivax sp.]
MRPPPPLTLRCATSRAWRGACALLAAAAAAALAAWIVGHLGWPSGAAIAAAALAAAAGGWLGPRVAAGRARSHEIVFDGQDWSVDGEAGALEVMLDAGRGLLLLRHRPRAGGPVQWLALAAPRENDGVPSVAGGAVGWRAMRTALYSPPPSASADASPAARPAQPRAGAADRVAD